MRHGEAVPPLQNDASRELTLKGTSECRESGEWMQQKIGEHNAMPTAVVSPYVRAQQSLLAVQEKLRVDIVEDSHDLVPSGSPTLVADYIQFHLAKQRAESALIISHMPLVSYLVDELCQTSHSILFPTAAVALLNFDQDKNHCQLEQLFHPA